MLLRGGGEEGVLEEVCTFLILEVGGRGERGGVKNFRIWWGGGVGGFLLGGRVSVPHYMICFF